MSLRYMECFRRILERQTTCSLSLSNTPRAVKANKTAMADRYFPNEMPIFVPENQTKEEPALDRQTPRDPLTTLLHLPYSSLSQTLKTSALNLKDTVILSTNFCIVNIFL